MKAKGLFSTTKSCAFVLSGCKASSGVKSSPSYLVFNVPVTDKPLDLVVSAWELNELALDLNVSPSNEALAGDEGTCSCNEGSVESDSVLEWLSLCGSERACNSY